MQNGGRRHGGGDEEGEASPASGEGERAPHPEKGSYPCVEDKHGTHLFFTFVIHS